LPATITLVEWIFTKLHLSNLDNYGTYNKLILVISDDEKMFNKVETRTAPRWESSFCLQSTFPDILESHSFKAFTFMKRTSFSLLPCRKKLKCITKESMILEGAKQNQIKNTEAREHKKHRFGVLFLTIQCYQIRLATISRDKQVTYWVKQTLFKFRFKIAKM
jgi:hypothetical protein